MIEDKPQKAHEQLKRLLVLSSSCLVSAPSQIDRKQHIKNNNKWKLKYLQSI